MEFIDFFEVEKGLRGSPKGSIHKNGRLGFNRSAEILMKLNEGNYILMGKAKESGELYLKVVDTDNPPRGTAFQLRKIQDYFYINTKALFDTVLTDYEYKKNRISFEITKEEIDGEVYFKMTPIQKKR